SSTAEKASLVPAMRFSSARPPTISARFSGTRILAASARLQRSARPVCQRPSTAAARSTNRSRLATTSGARAEMPAAAAMKISDLFRSDRSPQLIIWILALVLLTVATRLPLLRLDRPIDDEVVYGVVAQTIVDGGVPYVNAVERKPPLLFYVY